jgi:hypothetical protein
MCIGAVIGPFCVPQARPAFFANSLPPKNPCKEFWPCFLDYGRHAHDNCNDKIPFVLEKQWTFVKNIKNTRNERTTTWRKSFDKHAKSCHNMKSELKSG